MKKSVKIISAILAVTMLALLCCSCKKKDKGILLATYKGGEVYSGDSDLTQWSKYLNNYYADYIDDGTMTQDELSQRIVYEVVLMRLMELDIKARGLTVSDDEVKEAFDYTKTSFDNNYEGGYAQLVKDSGLTDDFWKAFARKSILREVIYNDLLINYDFTDEELTEYYNNNVDAYKKAKGYTCSVVFVTVGDVSDESAWTERKTAAKAYINRILAGEKYDDIKAEIVATYTEDNDSDIMASNATGTDIVSEESMRQFVLSEGTSLEDTLKALAASDKYKNMDQHADKSSDAYKSYLEYLIKCMGYSQTYALTHMNVGETYSEPIVAPFGWMILRLDSYNEKTYYPTLEEIRYELTKDYFDSLVENGSLMSVYQNDLLEKYYVTLEEFYATSDS